MKTQEEDGPRTTVVHFQAKKRGIRRHQFG